MEVVVRECEDWGGSVVIELESTCSRDSVSRVEPFVGAGVTREFEGAEWGVAEESAVSVVLGEVVAELSANRLMKLCRGFVGGFEIFDTGMVEVGSGEETSKRLARACARLGFWVGGDFGGDFDFFVDPVVRAGTFFRSNAA